MTIQKIDAQAFREKKQEGRACIIDVRGREEFASGSEASICWPENEINGASVGAFVREQNLSPDKNIILLCARGMRAQQAATKLQSLIPNPILVVEGGHAALAPTAPGQKSPISIERQVRIAAGALVFIGALASVFVHPAAVWICAFIGGGLVFAGITDWCGLGLLMMKMPWNKS